MVLRSRQSATSYHHTGRPDEALHSISPAEVAAAALALLQQQTSAAVQETS
jgi:hypothetical protein